jgi:hypothetical protein
MGVGIFSASMRVPSRKRLDVIKASVLRCEKKVVFAVSRFCLKRYGLEMMYYFFFSLSGRFCWYPKRDEEATYAGSKMAAGKVSNVT